MMLRDSRIALFVPVAAASFLILGLIAFVVHVAFARMENGLVVEPLSLINFSNLFSDDLAASAARNTIGFAALTVFVAALFGLPLAWLVERTDLRGKTALQALIILGLLLPGFFTAMGWVLLLHPRIGLVNQTLMGWFSLTAAPLPINSIAGMAWVEGLTLAPLFFLMTSGAFRSMDPALEEAARIAGASVWGCARRVLAPLFLPAVLAAAIFVFTTALGAFDVPGTIGLSGRVLTFSTYLYVKTSAIEGLPDYGLPAAFGACMLVFSGLVSLAYARILARAHRYQVVTGKAYRPRLAALGRWAPVAWGFAGLYILCALVAPLLLVIWGALLPFYQPPSLRALNFVSLAAFGRVPWDLVLRGLGNSIILALAAPTLALAASVAFSWVVLRSKARGRLAFDVIAFLPHAVPGIVFALGAVLAALFLLPAWLPLYGSLTIIVLVCAIGWVAFGTRVVNASLMQIHAELEEAGLAAGASRLTVLWRVLLPLMWPSLASAWVWLALLALRELTRAIILSSATNTTLPVITWSLWNGGQINQAAAIVLVTMALFSPLLVLYFRLAAKARAAG